MPGTIKTKIAQLREGKLTKSQRKLLDYFESVDYKQVIYMSITDLAAATDVAEATVLRFCRLLGFNGYQEFRLNLAQGVIDMGYKKEDGIGYVAEIADSYNLAMENCRKGLTSTLLKDACDMIFAARTVCCLGMGASFFVATAMHERLLGLGVASFCERDAALSELFIASRGPSDLLLVFGAQSRACPRPRDALRHGRGRTFRPLRSHAHPRGGRGLCTHALRRRGARPRARTHGPRMSG